MTQILKGKVKTVFETDNPEEVIIQYEDRVTAGNGKKESWLEGKGSICCEISRLLFLMLEKEGIRTHYITMPTHKAMCCRRVEIVPIEVVVRNIAAGSIVRQTTLEEGQINNFPLVEFYLKDDAKDDPLLTEDRICLMGYGDEIDELIFQAREINAILKHIFGAIGLTLVDFKLEFGYDCNDNLLLADELSPDGMRLWKEGTTESFDKDLFRKDKGDIVTAYRSILKRLSRI